MSSDGFPVLSFYGEMNQNAVKIMLIYFTVASLAVVA